MNRDRDTVKEAAHHFRLHGCLTVENSFNPELVLAMQKEFFQNCTPRDRTEVEKTCLNVGKKRYKFSVEKAPPYLEPGIYASPAMMPIVREWPILNIVYSRPRFLDRRNFDMQAPLQISRRAFESIPDEHRDLFRIASPAH